MKFLEIDVITIVPVLGTDDIDELFLLNEIDEFVFWKDL